MDDVRSAAMVVLRVALMKAAILTKVVLRSALMQNPQKTVGLQPGLFWRCTGRHLATERGWLSLAEPLAARRDPVGIKGDPDDKPPECWRGNLRNRATT